MAQTETKEREQTDQGAPSQSTDLALAPPRLRYPLGVDKRFNIDRADWKALVEAVFPNAKSSDSVVLALSYCKRRNLDPFKRVIHIVPIWDKVRKVEVETVWPGIAELRTTAFRTGGYAGRDATAYGDTLSDKIGNVDVTYPEWCQITVYRLIEGQRIAFPGPRVYWRETYAAARRDDPSPNAMWAKRPFGQIEKCAEAAALRAAFPEEIGGELTDDEAQGITLNATGEPEGSGSPAPTRAQFKPGAGKPEAQEMFTIVDHSGTELHFPSAAEAGVALREALDEAEKAAGLDGYIGVWESNEGFLRELTDTGNAAIANGLQVEANAKLYPKDDA